MPGEPLDRAPWHVLGRGEAHQGRALCQGHRRRGGSVRWRGRSGALLAAVQSGLVTEAAITTSAERILAQKFALGLFENPYVDAEAAVALVGKTEFQQEAQAAQAASHVLLKNGGPAAAEGGRQAGLSAQCQRRWPGPTAIRW